VTNRNKFYAAESKILRLEIIFLKPMKTVMLIFLLVTTLMVGVQSCKPGCADKQCLNGGECRSGRCQCEGRWSGESCDSLCAIGYEGRFCATPSSVKFLRTWNAVTTAPGLPESKHTLTITQGNIVQRIVISNFNGEGFNVVGTILDYNRFEILPQNATGSYTGPVDGSGYLNGNKLGINLTKQGIDYFANCNK
jgi:hypothetical protein